LAPQLPAHHLSKDVLGRDAAKFHQASRGAVHNHTSVSGVCCASFKDVLIYF
jgi:hypothetical protein